MIKMLLQINLVPENKPNALNNKRVKVKYNGIMADSVVQDLAR